MLKGFILIGLLVAFGIAAQPACAQPVAALPAAEKIDEHRSRLDTFRLIRGPIDAQNMERNDIDWLRLEGSSVLSYYRLDPETATLQVLRDYQRALVNAGFEVMFSCDTSDGSCYRARPDRSPDTAPYVLGLMLDAEPELPRLDSDYVRNYFGSRARYLLAARLEADTSTRRYLSLTLMEHGRGNRAMLREVAVELPAAAADVQVSADALLAALQRDGRARLRGLRFQPGGTQLQLGTEAALAELAELLHGSPGLRLAMVAHADPATPADQADALALQRAQALVQAMVSGEGIAATRLQARAGAVGAAASFGSADAHVELITLTPK